MFHVVDVDNIQEGQILFVISADNTTIWPTKVVKIKYYPTEKQGRHINFYTRYLSATTDGTVIFRPKDFGVIIFLSEQDALNEIKRLKTLK